MFFQGKANLGVGILAITLILDKFIKLPAFFSGLGVGLALVLIFVELFNNRKS
jgi:hypothetical protein